MTMFITILGGLAAICGAMATLYGLGAFGAAPAGMSLALTLVGLALLIAGGVAMYLSGRARG